MRLSVWLARCLLGAVFTASGISKAIDPYGTLFKLQDYLAAWHMSALVPDNVLLVAACALSLFEFLVGITLFTGSMRRTSAICATALMAVMLPLTAYIWIANPVADCGCFGDMIVLSNAATFWKNVLLTGLCLFLLRYNRRARCLFPPWVQWMEIAVAATYCLAVSVIGIIMQPLVDFRPYPIGTDIYEDGNDEEPAATYLYRNSKGEQKEFSPFNLPDDDADWEFVDVIESANEAVPSLDLPIRPDSLLIITVPDLNDASLYDGYVINEFADRLPVILLTGSDNDLISQWRGLTLAQYPIEQTDPRLLKTIVRGPIGTIMTRSGHIQWKSTLTTVSTLETPPMARHPRMTFNALTLTAFSALAAICLLGYIPRQLRTRKRRFAFPAKKR